jgi:hypothetical protein
MKLIYNDKHPGRSIGNQKVFKQGNIGLSVISQQGSFGYEEGLFEVCKFKFTGVGTHTR